MRSLLIIAAFCFSTPALAMTPAACAGGIEIAHAKIVRVEKNGALILGDGRAVMLEGIRLPLTDGGPPALAQDALHALSELAMAAPLTLTSTPPKEDRYDRVRVQAFGDVWLQTELLRRGLARVETAPDRPQCAVNFYAAEKEARVASRGLWAFPAFAVRKAESVAAADEGSFQLVEGKVVNSAVRDARVFLDFSQDYRHGFSATIAPEDRRTFRNTDPLPENLAGHTIRLRGMVQDYGGRPEIALSNPAQIEFVN
jgi:endonuclease YncB( thermonuclease family)